MDRQNRKLSPAEYYMQIQREYLIAQFRSKIYFSPKDKRYWKKVMRYKADKINSIASRNKLHSIFNSDEKMEDFFKKLFCSNGRPRFELTDEDWKNYYTVGNDFSYHGEIYNLDSIIQDRKLRLFSSEKNEFITVDKEDVCRII